MFILTLISDLLKALVPVVKDINDDWRVSTESLAALLTTVFSLLRVFGVDFGLDPTEFAGVLSAAATFIFSQFRKRQSP